MTMRRTCCSLDCVDTEEGAVILRMRSAKPEWQKSQAIFIRNFLMEKENKDVVRRSLDDTDTYILRQKYLRSYHFTRADEKGKKDEGRGGGGGGGGGGHNINMVRAVKKMVRSLVVRQSGEKEVERAGGKGRRVDGDIKLKVSLGTCFKLFLLSCVT